MIDAPDRETPRFPEEKAEAVRARIAQQLAQWEIGASDLAICGGACGADIFSPKNACAAGRGSVCSSRRRSMISSAIQCGMQGSDWVRRFHVLCEKAEVAILSERSDQQPDDVSIYARTNLWIIDSARDEAADPGKIYALLVWDEKPTGDGPGGTSDFQQKVCRSWRTGRRSSTRPSCHEHGIRIFAAPARATGKMA